MARGNCGRGFYHFTAELGTPVNGSRRDESVGRRNIVEALVTIDKLH